MIFFISCEVKKEHSKSEEFRINISNTNKSSFVSHLDQIKFIPLETNDSSIIGRIQSIKIEGDKIYIIDSKTQKVQIFSIKGEYLYSINKIGHGPEEYIGITDMQINKRNGHITLLDEAQYKILEFNANGSFVSEKKIPLKDPLANFAYLDSATLVFYKSFIKNDDDNSIVICSKDFTQIKKIFPCKKTTSLLLSPRISLQNSENQLFYLPIYSQKLFQIKKDEIKEKYTFNFGENNIDLDVYNQNYSNPTDIFKKLNNGKSIYFLTVLDSKSTVYADFYYKETPYFFVYNKDTKKTNVFYDEKMSKMFNSFYPYTTNNGKFVSAVSTNHLNEFSNEILKTNNLDNITSEANPIVIIYQFKE